MYNTVQINGDVKSRIVSMVNLWPSFILVSNFQIYNTGILLLFFKSLRVHHKDRFRWDTMKSKCRIVKLKRIQYVILNIT